MPASVRQTPRARLDLFELWEFIASDSMTAADRMLDRIDQAARMLAAHPEAGRLRPDLLPHIRSFPVGAYVLFYRPEDDGILLVRVLSGYRDIGPETLA